MKSRIFQGVAVAAAVLVAGCKGGASGLPQSTIGVAKFRIVNGKPDTVHTAVGAMDLGGGLCTGTLIAPRLVLTAAHCFEQGSAQYFVLGKDMNAASAKWLPIAKSIQHPQYDPFVAEGGQYVGHHDIAVAVLSQDAPATPMPYRTESLAGMEGSVITFVGFGEGALGLRYQATSTIGDVWSQGFWNYTSNRYPGNTCGGDSGGPALLSNGGVEEVIGVVSAGDEYCQVDGYNTRTDTNAAWLAQMMEQYGGGATTSCGNGTCDSGETSDTCPADCGGGTDPGDCQGCVESTCGAQMSACAGNQACVSLYECVGGCGDDACVNGCVNSYPGGVNLLSALIDCAEKSCAEACGGDPGDPGDDLWTPCGQGYSCPGGQVCVGTDQGNFCTAGCADVVAGTGCPSGFGCAETEDGGGVCVPSGTTCGDGMCGFGEVQASCPADCSKACGQLDDIGCCDGSVVTWCQDGVVKQYDCGDVACGWDGESGWYDCTGAATADPSGDHPRACSGAIAPDPGTVAEPPGHETVADPGPAGSEPAPETVTSDPGQGGVETGPSWPPEAVDPGESPGSEDAMGSEGAVTPDPSGPDLEPESGAAGGSGGCAAGGAPAGPAIVLLWLAQAMLRGRRRGTGASR